MIFNKHSNLLGRHAFLSASKYHWLNYDLEKLASVFRNTQASKLGVELHAFAHEAIRLGIKLPRKRTTLNAYVNDGIRFHMTPEQPLVYSENAFGTADTISFYKGMLRIHDLKTGETPASMHQLEIYAAFFCLEYGYKPHDLGGIDLCIYQNNRITESIPDPDIIEEIMNKIVLYDRHVEELKLEELGRNRYR